jgi:hypothetical protein
MIGRSVRARLRFIAERKRENLFGLAREPGRLNVGFHLLLEIVAEKKKKQAMCSRQYLASSASTGERLTGMAESGRHISQETLFADPREKGCRKAIGTGGRSYPDRSPRR